jgi:hypothetical protein
VQVAQRFVELQESADIVMALRPVNEHPQPTQDLSNLVEMWRKRLPNEWDEQNVWQNQVRRYDTARMCATVCSCVHVPVCACERACVRADELYLHCQIRKLNL